MQQRDLEAAPQALYLDRIPPYPNVDKSGLGFKEPLEMTGTAIAHAEFAALDFADEVEQHTGPRHFEGRLSHPPIGILARAELRFFRGVALLGLDLDSEEGTRLVNEALALIKSATKAVRQSAAALPEGQQARFLDQFTEWWKTADRIGGRDEGQSRPAAQADASLLWLCFLHPARVRVQLLPTFERTGGLS